MQFKKGMRASVSCAQTINHQVLPFSPFLEKEICTHTRTRIGSEGMRVANTQLTPNGVTRIAGAKPYATKLNTSPKITAE